MATNRPQLPFTSTMPVPPPVQHVLQLSGVVLCGLCVHPPILPSFPPSLSLPKAWVNHVSRLAPPRNNLSHFTLVMLLPPPLTFSFSLQSPPLTPEPAIPWGEHGRALCLICFHHRSVFLWLRTTIQFLPP